MDRFAFAGAWRAVLLAERPVPPDPSPDPDPVIADWDVAVKRVPRSAPAAAPSLRDGIASYYWQSQMTANGERFDKRAMTAAHRTLPFGSLVRVTHVATGRQVVVRINDRGPFKPGRVIDLSEAAADQLGFRPYGLARVQLEVLR